MLPPPAQLFVPTTEHDGCESGWFWYVCIYKLPFTSRLFTIHNVVPTEFVYGIVGQVHIRIFRVV